MKDVETFFHHIVFERKVNFHPDDMFEDYVSCESGINTFTLDECAIYNRLVDESSPYARIQYDGRMFQHPSPS